jgi:hypothetical protein
MQLARAKIVSDCLAGAFGLLPGRALLSKLVICLFWAVGLAQ